MPPPGDRSPRRTARPQLSAAGLPSSRSAARRAADAAAAPALQHLAELAMRLLGTAAAHVSLLTEVQTIAAAAGLARGLAEEVPLDEALCSLTAVSRGTVAIEDAAADERVAGLPAVVSGAVAAYLAAPLVSREGRVTGALCVSDPLPRRWTAEEQRVLEQLASFATAALELASSTTAPVQEEARRLLWDLSIASAGVGSFDWDLTTGQLHWDERLVEQFGYSADGFDRTIEAFNDRVHPDDLERVSRTLMASVEGGTDFECEYRVQLPDGTSRWISAKGQPLRGQDGRVERLLGATLDITGTRAGEAAVAAVHEAMNAAFFALDRSWRFSYVNTHAERLLQLPREHLLGASIWDLFPASVSSDFETHYRRAVRTGEPITFEAHYPAPLDAWYEVRAVPTAEGLSVYFLDITERHRAREAAMAAARRTALIADVTTALVEHLDAEEALRQLARLVVPDLGDWAMVTLVDDDHPEAGGRPGAASARGLRDVGGAHVDPSQLPLVEQYARLRLQALRPGAYLLQALAEGRPVVVPDDATAAVAATLSTPEAVDLITRLAPAHGAVVPLRARGRTLGVLSLFAGPQRGPFGPEELATAVDVAGRAGLALDNARLYRQQRDLASGLQRSLLTAPPEPDHTHVAVRYAPAAEAAQVGGDWYDAFLQPGGATVLVIGDVVGHDTQAAAAMSQVRTLLRGIGADGPVGPADLLGRVDGVMRTLGVATTATAVVARLEQSEEHVRRSETLLRWSSAGHPPPMVVRADGAVVVLDGGAADLLLGVLPDTERHERVEVLQRGATVLLYTDGLVERRGQSLEEGLERLRSVLEQLAALDLGADALCDAVLSRMLPGPAEDDVALVAVRLYPQDRPRPPEAGPERLPAELDGTGTAEVVGCP
ncbi:SpoIIE family protein phosphatase [Quadrisphaera sp. INWT6]|uniref:SpoIIE family protein phosphatase n=1 Tax=Quadrisphaera sp. INWT6 TaxID=2596917 RepID=UPI0028155925|nr:SpoIIE family protein phosphatase [Quadrisphaera sp. INWT6]